MPRDPLSIAPLKPVPNVRKIVSVRRPSIFKRVRGQPVSLSAAEEIEARNFPDPPPFWDGTLPEWAIYWAHEPLGRGKEGILWGFQVPIGGGRNPAGMVTDFLEFDERIAINVQGTYWHYRKGSSVIENDRMQRIIIGRFDYRLIFIDEPDAIRDPIFYLDEALKGIDHSLSARLYGG